MAPTVNNFASAKLHFASLPCSRFTDSLTSHPTLPIAAYISTNNVVILSCETYTVVDVIPIGRHSLNAVRFAPYQSSSDSPLLFAAGTDGNITLCSPTSSSQLSPFSIRSKVLAHDSSCLAMHVASLNDSFILTSVSDTQLTLTVLKHPCTDHATTVSTTYNFPTRPDGPALLPHAVSTYVHDEKLVFVAVAGTDKKIHLFCASIEQAESPGCEKPAPLIDIKPLRRISAHRDWVRALAWGVDATGLPLLASGSSDASIRLFRIAPIQPDDPPHPLHLQFEVTGASAGSDPVTWAIRSLCLLDEQSSTIHCIRFDTSGKRMLSTSLDGTVAVWNVNDPELPVLSARFGLLGGHSIHATGFFSASFVRSSDDDSTTVLAAGFSGALHRWRAESLDSTFIALPGVGGHVAPVRQVSWAPDGKFLFSASDDKSVRTFVEDTDHKFVEWARPQVHGHAIASIAFCNMAASRYVSAAEERMLRLFDAPDAFRLPGQPNAVGNGVGVARAKLPELGLSNKAVFSQVSPDESESGTNVNGDSDTGNDEKQAAGYDMRVTSTGSARGDGVVPLEEELKQETLWPETAKLYGHGNEVVRVATDPSIGTIASACRAQNARDAPIIIWDGQTGTEVQRLHTHELSITDLRFSADGKWLSSVSRDRSLAVFHLSNDQWNLVGRVTAAHSRVIFGCTWLASSRYVVTVGRDKWLRVFRIPPFDSSTNADADDDSKPKGTITEIAKLKFDAAVTAVDCSYLDGSYYAIAVGLETGDFGIVRASLSSLHSLAASNEQQNGQADPKEEEQLRLEMAFKAQERMRCASRVTSIHWRPKDNSQSENGDEMTSRGPNNSTNRPLFLAVGSEDMSVRVYSVQFNGK